MIETLPTFHVCLFFLWDGYFGFLRGPSRMGKMEAKKGTQIICVFFLLSLFYRNIIWFSSSFFHWRQLNWLVFLNVKVKRGPEINLVVLSSPYPGLNLGLRKKKVKLQRILVREVRIRNLAQKGIFPNLRLLFLASDLPGIWHGFQKYSIIQ